MQYQVISSSVGQEITGSIAKVLALGSASKTLTIDRIEYGNYSNETSFTPVSTTGPIGVACGTILEGPIGKIKIGSGETNENGALVYILNTNL